VEKQANKYRLKLDLLSTAKQEDTDYSRIELEFEKHDNIFSIIERIQQKDLFGNNQQAAEFAIGLKMFSKVMVKNRTNKLFTEFLSAFGEFMKNLKSS
jgi:hypothetical protein